MYGIFNRCRKARKDYNVRMHPVNHALEIIFIKLMYENRIIKTLCNPRKHLHPDIAVADNQDARL